MDSFQWFILAIIGFIFLAGCHRRYIKYRIVKVLLAEEKTTNDIVKILEAYHGGNDECDN